TEGSCGAHKIGVAMLHDRSRCIGRTARTNKDRLCERSEPQSYPVVGQARHGKQGSYIKANIFFDSEGI
ncbi:MAG: hypothetical protein KJO34_08500, partial [Deltaproteobacteria bacterium]|nr:hypothetical protein [Deltaproteobacteria bacterium]